MKKSPILNYEQNFLARFFQLFMAKNLFKKKLHCSVCTKKLLNRKIVNLITGRPKKMPYFGGGGVKNWIFLRLAVLVYFGFST